MKMKQKHASSEVSFGDQEIRVLSWGVKKAGLVVAELSFDNPLPDSYDIEGFWDHLQLAVEDTWPTKSSLNKILSVVRELRDIDRLFQDYLMKRKISGGALSVAGLEISDRQHRIALCTRVLPLMTSELSADDSELEDAALATAMEVRILLFAMQDELFAGTAHAGSASTPRSLSGRIAFAAAVKWKNWVATSFPPDDGHEFSENGSFGRLMNRLTADPRRAIRVRWVLAGGSLLVMIGLASLMALL